MLGNEYAKHGELGEMQRKEKKFGDIGEMQRRGKKLGILVDNTHTYKTSTRLIKQASKQTHTHIYMY